MARIKLGDGVILNTRSEWTRDDPEYRPRGNGTPRQLGDIEEFIVHHSGGEVLGDPDPAQWIRNIFRHHVHILGYVDIAYECLTDERGELWEGRSSLIAGAHTKDHNLHGYATCLLRARGDDDDDRVVPAQVQKAFRKSFQITDFLVQRSEGGQPLTETTHRRAAGNSSKCPGDDLDEFVVTGGLRVPFASTPTADGKWPPYAGNVLARGSRGKQVQLWQARLFWLGLDPGRFDGVFDAKTEEATKIFKALRGLNANNPRVGPKTWAEAGYDRR